MNKKYYIETAIGNANGRKYWRLFRKNFWGQKVLMMTFESSEEARIAKNHLLIPTKCYTSKNNKEND